MADSTSSSLFLVQSARGSGDRRFVLRLLDNRSWLEQEPDLADQKAPALEEARRAGLQAPRLVAYTNEGVGCGASAVLMTFLDGCVDLQPANPRRWIEHLARELAAIHRAV